MKNKLSHLNDHLFAQLERLSDEDLTTDDIDREVKRATAIVDVADQIVAAANLKMQAVKLVAAHGNHLVKHLPMIETAGAHGGPMIEGEKS